MQKEQWFYFKSSTGAGVAKVNSKFIADKMQDMDFEPCSYPEYLRLKKSFRDKGHEIQFDGVSREE